MNTIIRTIIVAAAAVAACCCGENNTTNIFSAITTNVATDWYVGQYGTNNYLEVNGGGRLGDQNGILGYTYTARFNSALITGSGSIWSNSAWLIVGWEGGGNKLTISNGASVRNTTFGIIGNATNSSNNAVLVTGANSIWNNNNGTLCVGNEGMGNRLTITNGALVLSAFGLLGNHVNSSNNTVLVAGAVWSNSANLSIGRFGCSNLLTIAGGGWVHSTTGRVGWADTAGAMNSNNAVLVTGPGSVWTNSDRLYIGDLSAGNRLTISNGGVVVDSYGYVGATTNFSARNIVLVTGSNSVWRNSNALYIGVYGDTNQLTISDGAVVQNSFGYIGRFRSSSNNTALVTGPGSTWSNSSSLYIGDNGSGNQLTISNGAAVTDSAGYIGEISNSFYNAVLVTGSNSVWNHSGGLLVGNNGSGNRLTVSNGAVVRNTIGNIGNNIGSSNNTVLVTGSNSVWSMSAGLNVGNSGASNLLMITDGGRVDASIGTIGRNTNISARNVALVTGSGSVWINSSMLYVGYLGTNNQMTISNGALVQNDDGYIGWEPTNSRKNSVLVTGSSSIWSNTGDLYIRGPAGSLVISNGGAVFAASASVSNSQSVIALSQGTLAAGSLTVHASVSGAGTITGRLFNYGTIEANVNGGTLYLLADVMNRGILRATNGGIIQFRGITVDFGGADFSGGTAIFSNMFLSAQNPTNIWIDPDNGFWVDNASWSLGVSPTNTHSYAFITNANTKIVYANTASIPDGNRTNFGLVVSAPAGSTNTLRVSGMTGDRFVVVDVTVGPRGRLIVTNETMIVGLMDGNLVVQGEILLNRGTLNASVARTTFGGTAAGTITLNTGTLTVNNQLFIETNATLAGSGRINGSITNNGNVTPGSLTVTGNFIVGSSGGALNIALTGPNTCGQLNVDGAAELGGTLNVFRDGYTPRSGEVFFLLNAPLGFSGAFWAINYPPLWPGLGWWYQDNAVAGIVILSVTGRAQLLTYNLYADYYSLGANSELGDANNNGIPNLMEYGLARDPTANVYRAATTQSRSNGWSQLNFTRNTDASNIAYRVETATFLNDGGNWSCILSNMNNTGWLGSAPYSESPVTDGVVQVIVTDTTTIATNRFLRLRVTRP